MKEEKNEKQLIPYSITTQEASHYSGIGINRLRSIMNDEMCPFVMYVGMRKRVKLEAFKQWLDVNPTV